MATNKKSTNLSDLDRAPIDTPAESLADALSSRQAASTGFADLFQADVLPQDVEIGIADMVRPELAARR